MNCDQVFDILTRGPFPTGSREDAGVERHLSACHECRLLAEALRPAVELFHEAVSAEELPSLPGYTGVLAQERREGISTAVTSMLRRDAIRPFQSLRSWQDSRSRSGAAQFFAAVVVGGVLCALLWGLGDSQLPPADSGRDTNRLPTRPALVQLSELRLPSACLERRSGGGKPTPYTCCTNCHSALAPSRPPVNALAAMVACHFCHE